MMEPPTMHTSRKYEDNKMPRQNTRISTNTHSRWEQAVREGILKEHKPLPSLYTVIEWNSSSSGHQWKNVFNNRSIDWVLIFGALNGTYHSLWSVTCDHFNQSKMVSSLKLEFFSPETNSTIKLKCKDDPTESGSQVICRQIFLCPVCDCIAVECMYTNLLTCDRQVYTNS